ncbi:hypothetical protein AVEN_113748-1 [Araneus ventricosus]|uniref:Uncharacterized protein n=1 Tax=Araneus ventricosus TaxID=182803 RepID=A0A4Y2TES6_ARAVE|nr:hypothetical protein AVEN_113748-1 [Araneus ventricosus]
MRSALFIAELHMLHLKRKRLSTQCLRHFKRSLVGVLGAMPKTPMNRSISEHTHTHLLKSSLHNQNKYPLLLILGGRELAILRGTNSMTRIQKFTPERRVVVESLHVGVKKGRNECAERLSTQKREFPLKLVI